MIVEKSTTMEVVVPKGHSMEVLVVGGGGGADSARAGSSGFFKKATLQSNGTSTLSLNVTIGDGGADSSDGGTTSIMIGSSQNVSASGGGGAGRPGWSGVAPHQVNLLTVVQMEQWGAEKSCL